MGKAAPLAAVHRNATLAPRSRGAMMLKQRRGGVRNSLTWLGWACVAMFVALMVMIITAAVHGHY
jgi:hypothetical protein